MRASREWRGRFLWILAAALGAATVLSSVALVHSSYRHRAVVRLLALEAAVQAADRAATRLELFVARRNGEPGPAPVVARLQGDSLTRLIRELFRPAAAVAGDDSLGGLARLDSLSLTVTRTDGSVVYGRLAPDRPLRATVTPGGPLSGLAITVALGAGQIPATLLTLTSPAQLWQNGFLLLSTLLVILLAVGSTRRELQLARARSEFIAGVSHDLRMPLAQILIAGETLSLRRERDEADRMALAGSVVREARRLVGLVDNVLLFSRSGAVTGRQRLSPVAVAPLLREAAEAVRLSAEDARQTVTLGASGELTVLGQQGLLRQALVNLIDNALKYGAPGQQITLSAAATSSGRVRLQVDDQGPGIPPAERAELFEPWTRLARDQDSVRTGSGLGLAVVRQIALACGGTAWLEDAPGGGTRAVLELGSAA